MDCACQDVVEVVLRAVNDAGRFVWTVLALYRRTMVLLVHW